MDILTKIIQAIEQGIEWIEQGVEWFLSTPLPYDTADAIYKIIENATVVLIPLMREYIDVIAGVSV